MLTYCGFNKEHPHDSHSILRLAFKNATDLGIVKQFMNDALEQCNSMFAEINDMF